MKKLFLAAAMAACCISCVEEKMTDIADKTTPSAKMVGNPFGEKEEGILLIKLSDTAAQSLADGESDYERIFDGLGETTINPVFPAETDAVARKHGLHKWHSVSFDPSVSVEAAAASLSRHAEIEAIEYNSVLTSDFSSESYEYVESPSTRSAAPSSEGLPFNDLLLKDQWDLINDGSLEGSVAGADVGVKDAWSLTAGDSRIIVAVLDQGIATGHPDLVDALWTNQAEITGQDGKDDDGNGYTDDKYGYNFAEDRGKPSYGPGSDHGTHIAGTIGAVNNNGFGVSSIAGGSGYGDGVRLMSCQTFKKDGQSTSSWIAKAFYYAAQNGASIAQCSYGYNDMTGMTSGEITEWMSKSVEYEALQYFLDPENANCEALETNIAIYSAGNYNYPASLYPGALKECVSVTAFCPDFLPGGYSNYGAGCDIAAPGGDITEGNANAPCMILSTGLKGDGQLSYVYKYGTSMACPHVTGVVALGASYALKIGKKFSREDFISRLLASANDIDGYLTGSTVKLWVNENKYVGTDVFVKKGKMGAGAVDAWKFLMALEGTPSFMTKPGQKLSINLSEILGADYGKYTLEMSAESKEALGVADTPTVVDGIVELTCTKIGSGKILFKASVGKDDAGVIPELDYHKEISIVSRPAVASNGGWL